MSPMVPPAPVSSASECALGFTVCCTSDDAVRPIGSELNRIGTPPLSLDRIKGVEDAYLDIFIAWSEGANESVDLRLTKEHVAKPGGRIEMPAGCADSKSRN